MPLKSVPIRVLLADDQVLFVESLRSVLETRSNDIKVVGTARDGHEAIRLADSEKPDIILMDVRMPNLDGVQATEIIHDRHPDIQIVMLTTFDEDEYVSEALRRGAVGYLLKNMPPADLIASIRSIKHGNVLISPEVAGRLIDQLQKRKGRPDDTPRGDAGAAQPDRPGEDAAPVPAWVGLLSRREREILRLLAQGFDNRKIADELHIAEQTVKNHVSVIYSKLGVHDRLDIIRLAGGARLDFDRS